MYKKIRKEQTLSGVAWEKRCTSAIIEDFPETKAAFMQAIEDSQKVNDVFARLKNESPSSGSSAIPIPPPLWSSHHAGSRTGGFRKNMTIIHNQVVEYNGYSIVGYNGRAQYIDETVVDAPQLYFAEDKAEADLDAYSKELDAKRRYLSLMRRHTVF